VNRYSREKDTRFKYSWLIKNLLVIINLKNNLINSFFTYFNQKTEPALEATFDQSSAAYLATGPVIVLPFISPLLLAITPALSSQ
jgi:hypothetical protein